MEGRKKREKRTPEKVFVIIPEKKINKTAKKRKPLLSVFLTGVFWKGLIDAIQRNLVTDTKSSHIVSVSPT